MNRYSAILATALDALADAASAGTGVHRGE
jgi:hypothetical protein